MIRKAAPKVFGLNLPFLDILQNLRNHFCFRLRAEIAFTMHAHRDVVRSHVANTANEHRVDFDQFRVLNLAVNFVRRKPAFCAFKFLNELGQPDSLTPTQVGILGE